MQIAVFGAGAWGTAIAIAAAARHDVLLWGRDAQQMQQIAQARRNAGYLPEVEIPDELTLSSDRHAALQHAQGGLAVIATPMSGLREALAALPPGAAAVWLCKGFEAQTALLGHEIAAAIRPDLRSGIVSGPSFALEVARGQPTALVVASDDEALRDQVVQALHGDALRVYTSADVIGVEVGGAVKNVLAIATGMADGLGLGPNARAALVTRGLAEMTRLGVALGAQPATFMGLSGVGDLLLTATGDLSRNRRVGIQLAAGQSLPNILVQLGHVAEGVPAAELVARRAAALGVEMPLTQALVAVLQGRMRPADAVQRLLRRDARAEF
jgi:glycerol-3-phosphate dehydrogenase (NAD(P)+)